MTKNFQVYKSSAGSGKTFTLAKFYLRLLLTNQDPNYFRHILAITFTVKAAAEMKQRIIRYLKYFSNSDKTDAGSESMLALIEDELSLSRESIRKKSELILNQIVQNYSDFSILTIDKFIHRIVRSFSTELNFSSDFEIEIDPRQIVEDAVYELIEECGSNEEFTPLLINFALEQSENDRSWDISRALVSLGLEINSEDFYLKSKSDAFTPSMIPETQDWIRSFHQQVEANIEELGKLAQEVIQSHGLNQADFYQGKRGVFGYFEKCAQSKLEDILNPNSFVLKSIYESKWQSTTKNEGVLEVVDELTGIFENIQSISEDVREAIFYKKLSPSLYSIALIETLAQRVGDIKTERNQQLLSDFYRAINQHLNAEQIPFVYERIGNRYNHILIDEFQDTSFLQWNALKPLLVNSLSEGKEGLIVGDAKQSIYRFRGSDPQQFTQLPNDSTMPEPLLIAEFEEHNLVQNFRSSRSVVAFNNRLFEELSSLIISEEFKDVFTDVRQRNQVSNVGSASVIGIESGTGVEKRQTFYDSMKQNIDQLQSQGSTEICALFQKNNEAAEFTSMMIEAGYDITSDESLLIQSSTRVDLVLATLRAMQNEKDPFFIQRFISKLHQNGLIQRDPHKIAADSLANKSNIYQILDQLGLSQTWKTDDENMYDFIVKLIRLFKFPVDDPYLTKLLDFSLEYQEGAKYLKDSFLDYWDRFGTSLSIDSSNESSALKVMTIHKSKGLEFENVLVYLPEISATKTTRNYLEVSGMKIPYLSTAFVPSGLLKDSPFDQTYQQEKDKTNLDLLNTIYVAFTRAKENLVIYTSTKNGKIKSEPFRIIQSWPEWNQETNTLTLIQETSELE